MSTERVWRDAEFICAFADSERHLGHIVKMDVWHAYDATHSNSYSNGLNYLGRFSDLESAKRAVEAAVSQRRAPRTMGAGGQ